MKAQSNTIRHQEKELVMSKTRPEDFQPDTSIPSSIKDLVLMEFTAQTDRQGNVHTYPNSGDGIDELMRRIYQRIEQEALATYHSNEAWALRAWALSNLLKDEVANVVSDRIADDLIAPIVGWQDESFDPISYFRERLEIERKSYKTVRTHTVTASRFVSKMGRRRYYDDECIIQYLRWANKNISMASYFQECARLLQFLRRLPEADRHRKLPISMPKPPSEYHQPTFTPEEVETIIWACVLDNIPSNMVVRLLVSSVFGARNSELAELSNEDIHLNGENSTLFIKTKKGGQKKPQPLPQSLLPLFDVSISPIHSQTLQNRLKRICKKARVHLPFKGGFHCFRRRVATSIFETESSEIAVHNFMRWSVPRQFSMLNRYSRTPVEVGDLRILETHPFVKIWAEVVPYILKFNSHYNSLNDNTK